MFFLISLVFSLTCPENKYCLWLKVDESLRGYQLRWYYYRGYDENGTPIGMRDTGFIYDFDNEDTHHTESVEQLYYALIINCSETKLNFAKFDIVGAKGSYAEYSLTHVDLSNACPTSCPSSSYCFSIVNSDEFKGHYNFYWYENGVEKQQYNYDEPQIITTTNSSAIIEVYVQGGQCSTKTFLEQINLPNIGDFNTGYLWPTWLFKYCLPDYCPNNRYCAKLSIPSKFKDYKFSWYLNNQKVYDYDFNNFSTQWAGEFEPISYSIYVSGGSCNSDTCVKNLDVNFASFKEYSITESDLNICETTPTRSNKAEIIVGVVCVCVAIAAVVIVIIIFQRKRKSLEGILSPSPLLS